MARSFVAILITCILSAGCPRGPTLVPAAGRVTLNGKPLETGAIMVQPTAGPAAPFGRTAMRPAPSTSK